MRTAEARLEDIDVFRGLTAEQLDRIAGCALERVFEAGEHLMREGDAASMCFAVRHGIVALETFIPQRGAVTIETLHPGDVVGWSGLFPPHRTALDARAARRGANGRLRRGVPAGGV